MKNRLFLGAGALLTATGCTSASEVQKIETPNIVIIYADDMGYGDMSCQNPNSKIQTPNLDALASQGMRFTDGHSSSGVSSPSRYAMLTGNYHWRRMNDIVGAFGESEFKEGELTMPGMLREAGYKTAMVGKWHLGWDWNSVLTDEARQRIAKEGLPKQDSKSKKSKYRLDDFDWSQHFRGGPIDNGFDTYFGDGTVNFPPYCWIENDMAVTVPTFMVSELNHKPLEGGGTLREGPAAIDWKADDVLPNIAKRSIQIIEEQDGTQPFFLYCALSAPHAPIIPSDEFHGKSDAGYYGDFVVQCDDIVGKVLAALKEKGLDKNTIVIFSADNGPEYYAYERIEQFDHNSTESLRGVKRDLWDGGHRIPFIVKWPDNIEAGAVSDELVSQVDLMATFAGMVGYSLPNDSATDSYDIMPILKGEEHPTPLREAMVHNTRKDFYALREGDWVMVANYTGSHTPVPDAYLDEYEYTELAQGDADALLYNIKNDQSQHNNVAVDHPELVGEMRQLLNKYIESGRSIPQRK
ncbi:MAG: arylsulfatase [Rikenellaceae bacterium]